jgi:hypothetical protein
LTCGTWSDGKGDGINHRLRQMDVDEIYKGKEDKFLTVVCKLETGEPLWIVYDKFDALQHANDAVDEVRRAEFFRQGPKKRGLIKGKKWLLPSR